MCNRFKDLEEDDEDEGHEEEEDGELAGSARHILGEPKMEKGVVAPAATDLVVAPPGLF